MADLKKVIIVSGATATGKTSLSIDLAKEFSHCEIVNFDSLCFYRELNIGTAKPNSKELNSVPHHLFNISSIKDDLNASDYCDIALEKIKELHSLDKTPILVGGSGFYLRALIKGMYDNNEKNKSQIEVEKLYEANGIQPIIEYLRKHDRESLANLHENDHYRLCRAMEFHLNTGKTISSQKIEFDKSLPYDFSKNLHNWNIKHIYLEIEKDNHWNLIEQRTEEMIKKGLIEEVENILNSGFAKNLKPLQCIGYKQVLNYLHQNHTDKSKLIESIYIATRRLAKSQKTFFKKITPKQSYNIIKDREKIKQDVALFFS